MIRTLAADLTDPRMSVVGGRMKKYRDTPQTQDVVE
jgi:hypothetical protein